MMGAYVVLALVVGKILLPRVQFNFIDILCFLVAYPNISHFHRSRLLPLDGVVCDADGCGIIAVHRCSWLGIPQFI
jgi:hypothetical protein